MFFKIGPPHKIVIGCYGNSNRPVFLTNAMFFKRRVTKKICSCGLIEKFILNTMIHVPLLSDPLESSYDKYKLSATSSRSQLLELSSLSFVLLYRSQWSCMSGWVKPDTPEHSHTFIKNGMGVSKCLWFHLTTHVSLRPSLLTSGQGEDNSRSGLRDDVAESLYLS